jgi:hypothetical protein
MTKENGVLDFLRYLSRSDAYHKLFVRQNLSTNEHVFIAFPNIGFDQYPVFMATDGKKYNTQGNCMNNPDLIIKQFVGEWTYKSTK